MSILISHESPLCMLQESLNYNDYQYILPYFYQRYPEYKEFMDNYKGLKILDNGLFEGEIPSYEELINIIKETNCNIFIPPDTWNNSILTLKDAKYWMSLRNNKVLPSNLNLMVVLQGSNFSEIEFLYRNCVDLGYKHFAFNHSSISYQNEIESLEGELTKAKVGRIELIRRLWNKNIIKPHHWIHLLGASDVSEFTYYKQGLPGIISSVDTSSPIIKGIECDLYSEETYNKKSQYKMEKYFDKEVDSIQEGFIFENIKIFKQLIK
jgi:hypothetical protein